MLATATIVTAGKAQADVGEDASVHMRSVFLVVEPSETVDGWNLAPPRGPKLL